MPQAVNTIAVNTNDSIETKSLFENHLLPALSEKPAIHFTQYDYIPAIILFLAFVLFVALYVYNRKRLNQIIKAFYLNRVANQLAREEVSLVNRTTILLSIVFLSSISLFTLQLINYYQISLPIDKFYLIWIIPLLVTLSYFFKIITIKLMGFIFKIPTEANNYIFTIFLFINALGLFILPMVVGIAFIKQAPPEFFINLGLLIIGLFLLTRMIRGVIIGVNSLRVSNIYLFLYLCTLEILPIFVLVKIFLLFSNRAL